MSKWPTIDEMLNSPIAIKRSDPLFISHQLPRFMRRKILLSENFDKRKVFTATHPEKPFHRRTVSDKNSSQSAFIPYGRVIEQVKSIYEKETPKSSNFYDEAIASQEYFNTIDPATVKSEFRYSSCPREGMVNSSERKKRKKIKSYSKIPHKIETKVDERFKEITKSNVLVLLNKFSQKNCENCGLTKCECKIFDSEIPENYLENIQRGKELIKSINIEKKKRKKTFIIKPEKKSLKKRSSIADEILKITNRPIIKKDPNLIEGTSIILKSKTRKNSA